MNPAQKPPLGPSLSQAQVDRIWSRLAHPAPRPPRRWVQATALVASMAAGALAVLALRPAPKPLLPVGEVVVAQRQLADGSTLQPEPGTRLEVVRSTGTELATLQRRGRCRYAVTEGGPRRWVVETDLGTVEVLGTIFTVDRGARGLAVSVERGKVFVHGSGRAVTLQAGESVLLEEPPPPATARPPELRGAPSASQGTPAGAVLLEAQAEDSARAAQRLSRWLAAAPRTADWAIVALRLGTLELDDNRAAQAALGWFDAVLEVNAPPTAVEDAAARRVEALVALGRREEALAAAEAFRLRWPRSPWVSGLPERASLPR